MWMRRGGRDGSGDAEQDGAGAEASAASGSASHAVGVGAVVMIVDGPAVTGDASLAGEPVGLVVASASDGLRSVSPVPTARGRAWLVELGSDGDEPGRRVVVPQSALRLADDEDGSADALLGGGEGPRA